MCKKYIKFIFESVACECLAQKISISTFSKKDICAQNSSNYIYVNYIYYNL